MKGKVIAGIVAITLITAILLAGCGPSMPAETMVLRYSTGLPPTDPIVTDLLPLYAQEIEKRTDGAIKIEVYGGAELYKHDEVVDAVTSGAVDMALNSPTHWGGRNPVFAYPGYFFVVTSSEQYAQAKDEVHKVMEKIYEEQGAKMMYYCHYSSTAILTKTPINTLADFKGKKIRGPAAGHVASIETLGAVPAKMAAAEVYDAIAKGAIDGAFSGYSTFNTRKWYEVAKYVIGPVLWDPWYPTMNLALWNSLPGSVQKVFNQMNEEFSAWTIEWKESFDEDSRQVLRDNGVTIKDLSPQEATEWANAMKPGYEKWVQECEAAGYGDEARTILKAFGRL